MQFFIFFFSRCRRSAQSDVGESIGDRYDQRESFDDKFSDQFWQRLHTNHNTKSTSRRHWGRSKCGYSALEHSCRMLCNCFTPRSKWFQRTKKMEPHDKQIQFRCRTFWWKVHQTMGRSVRWARIVWRNWNWFPTHFSRPSTTFVSIPVLKIWIKSFHCWTKAARKII